MKLPDGGAPRAHRVVSGGESEILPRGFQAQSRSASASLDNRAWTLVHWDSSCHQPPTDYEIAELVAPSRRAGQPLRREGRFHPRARPLPVRYTLRLRRLTPSLKSDVIDLTSKLRPDGTLDWTPPAGDWVVLRFGYSLLGITNHPATAEATGLEVDKLNRGYVKNYMDGYLDSYKDTVGAGL